MDLKSANERDFRDIILFCGFYEKGIQSNCQCAFKLNECFEVDCFVPLQGLDRVDLRQS